MPASASLAVARARASPSVTPPSRSCRRGLERAPPLVGGKSLRELLQLPLEDLVEPVNRVVDAVVGQPVLGEVVGTDLLGAPAAADLRAPRLRLLGLLALALQLEEPR